MKVNFTFEKAKFDIILTKLNMLGLAYLLRAPHLALVSYSYIFPKANPAALQLNHLIYNSRDNPPTGQFRETTGDSFDTNHVLQDLASVPN
jgi:hypothetical protein